MDRSQEIIRTSWIGIIANVLLAGFKTAVGIIVLSAGITSLIESVKKIFDPTVPSYTTTSPVVIVVDHNYSE